MYIDWGTKIIYVDRDDLTLVQSSPTYIYNLDLNWFRLQLKDLEDSEEGMSFPMTHNHNTEVVLSGLTYARVIEIINDYTITFEDGVYAVNLIGANSNVADKVNVNQVSVRSSNSAGLISIPIIEFSSFNNSVCIDTRTSNIGTTFPVGTRSAPVNNLNDAKLIAEYRGFDSLSFLYDFTFGNGVDVSNYTLYGKGMETTTLTFSPGCLTSNTKIIKAIVDGEVTDISYVSNSRVIEITGSPTIPASGSYLTICDSALQGVITFPANFEGQLSVVNCFAVTHTGVPIIDLNGASNVRCSLNNYSGSIKIQGCTKASSTVIINLNSGNVILDSSNTAGNFIIRGTGTLTNETTSLTSLDISSLLNSEEITKTSWQTVYINTTLGVSGTEFPIGTAGNPSNNIEDAITIAEYYGIRDINFTGEISLFEAVSNITFTGVGTIDECVLNLENQLLNTVLLKHCVVRGKQNAVSIAGEGWAKTKALIEYNDCYIEDVEDLEGTAIGCQIEGDIKIKADGWFSSVETVIEGDYTFFDLRNSSAAVSMDMNSGYAHFINAGEDSLIELNVKGGEISFDSTCVSGTYYLEGVGTLYNESTMEKSDNHLIWDEKTSYHTEAGSTSKALIDAGSAGNPWGADLSSNNDIGTFGAFIQTLLTAASVGELDTIPDVDATLAEQIQFLYQYFRNKRTVSNTEEKMYKENNTLIGTSTLGDDGSTFTRGKMS